MDRKIIDFDQGWDFIQKGITKVKRILEGVQESHLSCEEYMLLYTTIFNMCTQKPPHDYSQQLYHKYKEAFDEYIKSTVLPSLNQKHDEFMLRELVQRWSNHKVMVRWLSHFFDYLDRFFLARRSLPGLNAVGLACFRDLVYMAVRANVRKAVISLIDKEREGEQIDRSLLKNVLDIFVEIGMGEMEQYEQDFEVQLLEDTANYYKSKATNWIEIYSCPDYMLKVEDCLRRERDRVSHYLHSSTEQKLVEKVRHELLVAHANFKFSLVDQVNRKMTQTKGTEHEFDAEENDWVFTNLIPLYELHDPRNGFIVNDTCVIEHSDNPDIARTDLAKAEEGFTGCDLDAELGYGGPQCCCMENQNTSNTMLENKFTWRIENFSKLNSKKLYSENFFIGGHSWRILIFPKGNNVDYLSIYLDAGDVAAGGNKFANFKLSLVDQFNCKMTQTKETEHEFDAEENDWGFTNFIPLYELHDYRNGFIVNDTCVIEAEISVPKSEHENQLDQAVSLQVCAGPIKHGDNPLPKEMSTTSFGELVDFRGLGKLEKALVPLLEEVCSQHPSLIDSQQRRSRRFVEWAFTALGRVLHFLKTKKVKDMNDEACNHLQILWEELETFKFDLTWLEPHFQSALGMKNYMERAVQVKKLKENVAALEMETKRLKARMAAIEVDLEIARTDLVKAKEGFTESHLDAELGYGGPQVSVTY